MSDETGSLEQELKQLSLAMMGESLREEPRLEALLALLRSGSPPLTVTLWWDPEKTVRQSVVLHEHLGDRVRLFDPTHTLEEAAGMVELPISRLVDWFETRDALGLIPESL